MPAPNTSNTAKWVVIGVIAVLLFLVLAGGGLYYLATEPQRVEGRATESLELYYAIDVLILDFPREPRVAKLTDGSYGKHRFSIRDSSWDVQRNDSVAYPFKGEISVTYRRSASISHKTKAEAEADGKFFQANYGTISWLPDTTTAENAAKYQQPTETCRISLIYDKANRRWVEKSRKTE